MKASIVIPAYNSAAWLPHAVESALKQTVPAEVVVVNDGSTDSTADYLAWLRTQSELVRIHTTGNQGRCAARNFGNRVASGDVILVLDADDYCSPNRVKLTLDKFKAGAQYVYGGAEVMDFSGTRTGYLAADVFDKDRALKTLENRIVHSSVAYTKELAKAVPYSTDKEVAELGIDDWEHQVRVALGGWKMDFVSQPIVAYRTLDAGISNRRDPARVTDFKRRYLAALEVKA